MCWSPPSKKVHSTFHERTDGVSKDSELTKQLLESRAAAIRRTWLNQWLPPGVRIRDCKAFSTWLGSKQKEVFSMCQVIKGHCGCRKVFWIQGETGQEQTKPNRFRVSSHELKCLCAVGMLIGCWSTLGLNYFYFFHDLLGASKKVLMKHVFLLPKVYQLTAFSSEELGFCGTNPTPRPSFSYCENIPKSEISKPPTMSFK